MKGVFVSIEAKDTPRKNEKIEVALDDSLSCQKRWMKWVMLNMEEVAQLSSAFTDRSRRSSPVTRTSALRSVGGIGFLRQCGGRNVRGCLASSRCTAGVATTGDEACENGRAGGGNVSETIEGDTGIDVHLRE
jgi:hypothetical protein